MIGKIIALVLIVALLYVTIKSAYVDTYEITGTVKSKWIDPTEGGSAYLVRLTDNTMLEVNRNVFYGGKEFNPDIIYDSIQLNKTYRFTCWGWRAEWAFFYWYPFVLRAELLE